MTEKIKQYLSDLESQKNIKILWACETGSRAWGFPSTDSDYDIRLIYVHQLNWYLNLVDQKDNIDLMLDNNDIDISGWELKKSLNLLRKSNAPLLERIQSPIVYVAEDGFIKELKLLAPSSYSRIATIHHYWSMANKFFIELQEKKDFKLKKFFYTLRSACVCKWILEKEEIPPIEFHKVYKTLNLEPALVDRIDDLIELKSKVSESYYHQGEAPLFNLIQEIILEAEKAKDSLANASGDLDGLNLFFQKWVRKCN